MMITAKNTGMEKSIGVSLLGSNVGPRLNPYNITMHLHIEEACSCEFDEYCCNDYSGPCEEDCICEQYNECYETHDTMTLTLTDDERAELVHLLLTPNAELTYYKE